MPALTTPPTSQRHRLSLRHRLRPTTSHFTDSDRPRPPLLRTYLRFLPTASCRRSSLSRTLGEARLLGFKPWRRSALPDQGITPLVAGNLEFPSGRNDSACDWWGSTRIGHILILARQHRLHSHTCFHSGTDPIATTRTFPTPARPLPPTRGHAQISAFGILPPPRCSFRTPGGARLLGPRAWAQECSA